MKNQQSTELDNPASMMSESPQEGRVGVLVIDDSPVSRKLVEITLPPDEYKVVLAKTGNEALGLFAEHRPAVVITDLLMPDLSGIEICERLRSDYSNLPTYIILVSGVSEKSKVVKGLQSGADDYLTKPFDPAELLARVEVGRRIIALHREIEAKNRLLEQMALTDELTGLPNRRAITQWADRQLSGAVRHEFPFWIVMMDLDRFKVINDTFGHVAGDQVLKKFAEVLHANTRQCDISGRLGGDEFVWIITFVDENGVHAAVERLRKSMESQKFTFGEAEVRVAASFGIVSRQRGMLLQFDQLLGQADVALYSAKRLGRGSPPAVPAATH